jgi:hypothetical protein
LIFNVGIRRSEKTVELVEAFHRLFKIPILDKD